MADVTVSLGDSLQPNLKTTWKHNVSTEATVSHALAFMPFPHICADAGYSSLNMLFTNCFFTQIYFKGKLSKNPV